MKTTCALCNAKVPEKSGQIVGINQTHGTEQRLICNVCSQYSQLHAIARALFVAWIPAIVVIWTLYMRSTPTPIMVGTLLFGFFLGILGSMHYNTGPESMLYIGLYSFAILTIISGRGQWWALGAFLAMVAIAYAVLTKLQAPGMRH